MEPRVASMMSGRPLMLTSPWTSKLNFPAIIDDEEMTEWPQAPGQQPREKLSYLDFFFQAIKLVQIAGEILKAISLDADDYGQAQGDDSSSRLTLKAREGDFHDILQLDAALTRWHDELPCMLRLSSSTTRAAHQDGLGVGTEVPDWLQAVFTRQSKVLEVRYVL